MVVGHEMKMDVEAVEDSIPIKVQRVFLSPNLASVSSHNDLIFHQHITQDSYRIVPSFMQVVT